MEKNILFLMGVYPSYGGVEKVSTILANEFVTRGYKVSIVSFEQPIPELATTELDSSVNLYHLEYPVFSKKNILKLSQIIKEQSINFVINQWCLPYYVARLIKHSIKDSNCKLISVHHNQPNTNARIKAIEINIENAKGFKLFLRLKLSIVKLLSRLSLRYTYNASDLYVVLSPSFIPIAQKYMFLKNNSKIISLTNPLTIESMPNWNKEKLIVYVGRIEYNQKRTYRVVDVWSELEHQFPDWKLLIVGDGPDREDLQKRIARKELKNIEITGFVDPVNYYKKASLLLLTSEYEGVPLVIIEAMSLGVVPVLYGSFDSANDILNEKNLGFVSEKPYNKQDLIDKLSCLMKNKNTLRLYSNNCVRRSSDFSLANISDQWEQLFKKLN